MTGLKILALCAIPPLAGLPAAVTETGLDMQYMWRQSPYIAALVVIVAMFLKATDKRDAAERELRAATNDAIKHNTEVLGGLKATLQSHLARPALQSSQKS